MNAEQFRAAFAALGLKQTGERGVDKFLGVGEATIRRWARGTAQTDAGEIPESVAMLLTLMIAKRVKPVRARQMLDGLDALLAREVAES